MSHTRLFSVALMLMLVMMLACSGQQADTEAPGTAAADGSEGEVFESGFEEGGTNDWQEPADQTETGTEVDDQAADEGKGDGEAPAPE